MPTLEAVLHGNISIELEYYVTPGEPMIKYGPNAGPGCEAELHFHDEEGAQVMVIDGVQVHSQIRIDIELGDDLSDKEWSRLTTLAWEDFNNHPSTG